MKLRQIDFRVWNYTKKYYKEYPPDLATSVIYMRSEVVGNIHENPELFSCELI